MTNMLAVNKMSKLNFKNEKKKLWLLCNLVDCFHKLLDYVTFFCVFVYYFPCLLFIH